MTVRKFFEKMDNEMKITCFTCKNKKSVNPFNEKFDYCQNGNWKKDIKYDIEVQMIDPWEKCDQYQRS